MIFGINTTYDIIFKIVSNFTHLMAREIIFEISLVVFMPNIITNHAITNSKRKYRYCINLQYFCQVSQLVPVKATINILLLYLIETRYNEVPRAGKISLL